MPIDHHDKLMMINWHHDGMHPRVLESFAWFLNADRWFFRAKHPCDSKCCSVSASVSHACWDSGYISMMIQAGSKQSTHNLDTIILFLSRTENIKPFRLGLWHFRVNVAGLGATGEGGKPIKKIRKLNLCLLRRRENAVQRTPSRAIFPWADYAT